VSLPVADPQFWIVTAAAVVALAMILRLLLWRPKATPSNGLPCARCAQAGEIGHPPTPRRRGGRAVLLALAVAGAQPVSAAIVERDVAAMGSALRLSIEAVDRPTGLAVSNAIVAAVEDAERRLSTWLKASELVSYNAAPSGAKVAFSPLAWHAVETAIACWRETGGAFDPTVAPLVEAWGLRSGGRLPVASEIETARRLVDAGRLELDREHRRVGQPGGRASRRAASAKERVSTQRSLQREPWRRELTSSSTSAVNSPGRGAGPRSRSRWPIPATARGRCSP
jgi:hypothetical protein